MAKTSQIYEIVSSRVAIRLISYLMITTTLHCSICISIFTFNFNVKVFFYNMKLIIQKSNRMMLLARFFLLRIMFIIRYQCIKKNVKPNCLYSTFCGAIYLVMANFCLVMANFYQHWCYLFSRRKSVAKT